jgi:hypothetical protein
MKVVFPEPRNPERTITLSFPIVLFFSKIINILIQDLMDMKIQIFKLNSNLI